MNRHSAVAGGGIEKGALLPCYMHSECDADKGEQLKLEVRSSDVNHDVICLPVHTAHEMGHPKYHACYQGLTTGKRQPKYDVVTLVRYRLKLLRTKRSPSDLSHKYPRSS